MYKFVLYISDSISALLICSSVLFLCIPHVSDITWYLFFSFWLTSLCMTISRSIHKKYRSMRKDSPKINPGMWDLSFLSRYPTCASCSESTESKLLNYLGDLPNNILDSTLVFELCLHLILKKSKQYSPCMGAAYLRGRPDLAAPMLSFQSCFFWHQRGKCKFKKKKRFLWLPRRLSSLHWKWCQFSKILVRLSHTVKNGSYSNVCPFPFLTLHLHFERILSSFP